MKPIRLLVWTFAASGLVAPAVAADPAPSVTAFVAASTQDVVKQIAEMFTEQTGIAVKISPGGSNTLANQIMQGAAADVFLSANTEWAEQVAKQKLLAESRPLLTNDLVLVVPKGNPARVHKPKDLLGAGVAHVALAGEKVPAGIYAQQALSADGVYDQLVKQKRIVRGQDVRATLTFVARGEAEAGVVYWTDALSSDKVQVATTFDPEAYEKVVYPLVLLEHGANNPAAKKFYEFLGSASARRMFTDKGFRILTPEKAGEPLKPAKQKE